MDDNTEVKHKLEQVTFIEGGKPCTIIMETKFIKTESSPNNDEDEQFILPSTSYDTFPNPEVKVKHEGCEPFLPDEVSDSAVDCLLPVQSVKLEPDIQYQQEYRADPTNNLLMSQPLIEEVDHSDGDKDIVHMEIGLAGKLDGDGLKKINSRAVCIEDNWSPPSANIQSLPQELLLIIFSFLTPAELCDTVSQVCTQWNELHLDPSLFRVLTLQNETTKNIIKFIRHAKPQLKSLTLIHNDFNPILEELWNNYSQLRSLSLVMKQNCRRCINFHTFLATDDTYPKINTFKLEGLNARHLSFSFRYYLSPMISHLQTLHFVCMSKFSSQMLLDLVMKFPQLADIKVYTNFAVTGRLVSLTDNELITICEHLSGTLRALHADSEWSPQGLNSLKQCHLLQDLGIYQQRGLSPESLVVIGSMANLRKLQIVNGEELTEDAWIRMLTSPEMKNLESLSLEFYGHLNKVAETVGAYLSKLTSLSLLRIPAYGHKGNNQLIFRTGIASILRGCRMLETLDLTCVDFPSLCAFHLIHRYLPRLKRIYNNNIRIDAMKDIPPKWLTELTNKMPDLKLK